MTNHADLIAALRIPMNVTLPGAPELDEYDEQRKAAADALEESQENSVFRGETHLKVGQDFYVLSDLVEAAYKLVSKSSDNPGFDMPQWFYSGSPYGAQIRALGVSPCQEPNDFRPEYLPQSEKHPWNRHASWWRNHATGLDAYAAKAYRRGQEDMRERAADMVRKARTTIAEINGGGET